MAGCQLRCGSTGHQQINLQKTQKAAIEAEQKGEESGGCGGQLTSLMATSTSAEAASIGTDVRGKRIRQHATHSVRLPTGKRRSGSFINLSLH